MSDFRIPEGVAPTVILEDCGNCASPTPVEDLAAGLCRDCQAATARALAAALKPETFAEPAALPIDEALPEDELEQRRARRAAVKEAADQAPQGWLQHAVEAVRFECIRGRLGHEFTIDTIFDVMEAKHAPMPPERLGMRFVMEEATRRGWCAQTERTQPSRRDEMRGRPVAVYRSCL